MKKVILAVLLMMSFTNIFASTSSVELGEDLGYRECKESIQESRHQERLSDAKDEIQESVESTIRSTDV